MEAPSGRVAFLDGMRISREHLEHLQAYLRLGVFQLRETVGEGRVAHGLKTKAAPGTPGNIQVSPGLALDAFGRPLSLDTARTLPVDLGTAPVLYAVLAHDLRYGEFFKGFPTVITDHVKLELRSAAPPYADGGVRFAEIRPAPVSAVGAVTPAGAATPAAPAGASGLLIAQAGEWYLPPLDHGHSGRFYQDEQARMRYDGHPLGLAGAMYDSGFVHIEPGGSVHLRHGLRGQDFLTQLEAANEHGMITNHGSGRDFWYELPSDGEAVISRTKHKEYSRFRLRLWPFGTPGAAPQGPILPIANAGPDNTVELGQSFILDGGQSRSPAGLPLRKYKWIQLS